MLQVKKKLYHKQNTEKQTYKITVSFVICLNVLVYFEQTIWYCLPFANNEQAVEIVVNNLICKVLQL